MARWIALRSHRARIRATRWLAMTPMVRCPPYNVKSRTRRSHPAFPWSRVCRALLALGHVDVVAACDAGVELARTADLLMWILDHLAPLADPADGAGDREQHGEHRGRETHRLQ